MVTFENKNDGRDWTLSDEQLGEYLLDSVGQQKRPLTEKREHGATAVFLFFFRLKKFLSDSKFIKARSS